VAGAIDTSRLCLVITIVAANETVITSESARPPALGRVGPPTITPTPVSAIAIESQVRRITGSPTSIPSAAARSGASASMKRMFATLEWLSATMKVPDEIAISPAIASPPRPIALNASPSPPRSATAM
jgi:hypothetical protein